MTLTERVALLEAQVNRLTAKLEKANKPRKSKPLEIPSKQEIHERIHKRFLTKKRNKANDTTKCN